MTENEINALIDAEYKTWNDAIFDMAELPADFVDRFKVAVFNLSPKVHQLPTATIRNIINKNLSQITNLDVPIIINTIQHQPMSEYSKTLRDGLVKNAQIEDIKVQYNIFVQKLNQELSTKRENMLILNSKKEAPLKLVKAQA